VLERLKTYTIAALGLLTPLLYILLRRQVRKTQDAEHTIARNTAERDTQDARRAADSASKENANAQEEYERLRNSRPDLFPPRQG
jgi:hypothetical protein